MRNHECVIGIRYDYDNTDLVTLEDLKRHINYPFRNTAWSLKDYCDKRKNTDLTRFDYCPYCGKKIEWKKIKEGA